MREYAGHDSVYFLYEVKKSHLALKYNIVFAPLPEVRDANQSSFGISS